MKERGREMKLSNNTLELMKEITQIVGISGNEKNISKAMQSHYKKYTDEIIFDKLGSVFAVKKSSKENAPRVMVSAHMDEFGFIVTGFTANGLIKILPLGTVWNQTLLSQRVRVVNCEGKEFTGAIVTTASEEEKSKLIKADKMLVDIGATSKEEVEALGIKLGDSIVCNGEFEVLAADKRLISKAWNGRYGCIMGIEILEALKYVELDVDLYVGCTVQEEVGLRGSQTSTNLIKPDLALVMDCLQANDIKGDKDTSGKLGEGVLINYYDKSMMPNRKLLNHLVTTCKENDIKHQYFYSMSDSDAGWIHKLRTGCPTLTACICARNVNTVSSIIDVDDYIAARKSIIEVIKSLNTESVEGFKIENR